MNSLAWTRLTSTGCGLVLAIVAVGCERSSVIATANAAPAPLAIAPRTSANQPAPTRFALQASLDDRAPAPDMPGHPTRVLTVTVHGRSPLQVPIRGQLAIPPGVRVLRGAITFTIPANAAPEYRDEIWLAYDAAPADDVLLTVDVRSEAAGQRMERRWRFGRAEPAIVLPVRSGPHVMMGDLDLGPSIQVPRRHSPR